MDVAADAIQGEGRSFAVKKFITQKAGAAMLLALASGCAIKQQPTQFTPLNASANPVRLRLTQRVDFSLSTGYTRTLKSGSLWTDIGSVPQGEVLKPYHDVFTLEGSNVQEAYLVVANNTLSGFYLPYEHKFSPIGTQISLPLSKQE